MRILMVLTYYHPHWTGLTANAKRLAEGLAAHGHSVTVLTSRHLPELARQETVDGVRVIRSSVWFRVSRTVVMPWFPVSAVRLMLRHDIVMIHTPLPELPLVTFCARVMGKPSLAVHHGDVVMPSGWLNRFVQWVMLSSMTFGFRLSNYITVLSSGYGRQSLLLTPFSHKLEAIYPVVQIPQPRPRAVAALRQKLNLDGKYIVGFAGRFVEEKGFDRLLKAIPLVSSALPQVHFVFAGSTEVPYERFYSRWRDQFEQERALTSLGLIQDPAEMADFYGLCDVFVLPSRTDCFAVVQVEAMLCGTPVVATAIPGGREVVEMTGFGLLAQANDEEALALALLEVLRCRDRYRPDSSQVRRIFDTATTINRYEQLMQQLIAKGSVSSNPSTAKRVGPTWPSGGGLSVEDRRLLERLLSNEADMAFRRRSLTLLDWLDLRDGDVLLDCGCGMGVHLFLAQRLRRLQLVGVDQMPARLFQARLECGPIPLSAASIENLPFPAKTFDRVLMTEVLEHIADEKLALRELHRVMKPGAVLALSVPHANYPFWWDPVNKTLEAVGVQPIRYSRWFSGIWSNHWRLYRPNELVDLLQSAGFEVDRLQEQTHYCFPLNHLLIYGIGKPLIEHGLLPRWLADAASRFRGESNSRSWWNPINVGVALLRWVDRWNERQQTHHSYVNIVLRSRKR